MRGSSDVSHGAFVISSDASHGAFAISLAAVVVSTGVFCGSQIEMSSCLFPLAAFSSSPLPAVQSPQRVAI